VPENEKTVQYLQQALATEAALAQTLVTHIAVTPRSSYRDRLESRLRETRKHAGRLGDRLEQLGIRDRPGRAAADVAQTLAAPVLAAAKTPLDLVRGSNLEEKLLRNARDEYASESFAIATYLTIEALAREYGDGQTERLAQSVRREEEQMLSDLQAELGRLAAAVVERERSGGRRINLGTLGAVDGARIAYASARDVTRRAAFKSRSAAKSAGRDARKVPGVATAEGGVRGVVASEEDLPIAGYDSLTAQEIISRIGDLPQRQLAMVEVYEQRHEKRRTVLDRIESLRAEEPWPGYDELSVEEIRTALDGADAAQAKKVADYERRRKNRSTVLDATRRKIGAAS
jgi:ferritin-like metal-binding protein YciE